jgi:xanthine/uracil/vitamin C permease (AzgA family)
MCSSIPKIRWNDLTDAFPAFITMVAMPLTFSIATGLSLGMLSYTFIKLGHREIRPLLGPIGAFPAPVRIPRARMSTSFGRLGVSLRAATLRSWFASRNTGG